MPVRDHRNVYQQVPEEPQKQYEDPDWALRVREHRRGIQQTPEEIERLEKTRDIDRSRKTNRERRAGGKPIGDITGHGYGPEWLGEKAKEAAEGLGEALGGGRYEPNVRRFDLPGYREREQEIAAAREGAGDVERMFGRQGQRAVGLGERLAGYRDPRLDVDAYEFWKSKMRGEDSLAQRQLQEATDRSRKFALAQAATGRGNPAMAARLASQRIGQAESTLGAQAATAGIQERAAAGQLTGQMAGQNLQAALQAQGMRQAGLLGAGQLQVGLGQLQLGAGRQGLEAQDMALRQAIAQQRGGIEMERLRQLAAARPTLGESLLAGGMQAGAAWAGS
jgi:hypothetical protein